MGAEMSTKPRLIYFDAMVDSAAGIMFFEGVQKALEKSPFAESFDLVPIRFNYGDRPFSPRLMAELSRDHDAQAIILSGSEKNTSEVQNAWVRDYYFGLERMLDDAPDRPVFGICFGHQAIACLFGGETSRFSYRAGFTDIQLAHQGTQHPVLRNFSTLRLGVSHGDHVVRVPPGFQLLATSDYCDCQALAHDTRPIFSMQSHPEITKEIREVATEKKSWDEVKDQEFETQDGPKLLEHVFAWMQSKI
jgi:GMP synthase-like glutamine amidotransferase